jgi:phage gp36-like protein
MADWITLTEALVANRMTGAELTAMKTAALGGGQSGATVLADCISAVVREVRGYVAACATNTLGDGETIPQELEHAALALLRQRLANRLPGMAKLMQDDARKAEYDDAVRLLRDVAACRFAIISPDEPASEQPALGGTPRITERERTFTRCNGDGL